MATEDKGLTSDAEASGARFIKDRHPISLAPTSAIEMNLLSVPIAVLNTRAAKASNRVVYEWCSGGESALFAMNRPDAVAFPQIQHAEVFYTLLSMFAQRFNDDGELSFRMTDVARNAGKHGDGGSVFTTIKEAIWRYSKCSVEWSESWEIKGGEQRRHNWDGPLIIANTLFTTQESLNRKIKNPRRSRQTKEWHSIIFHPLVVQSIKSQFVRVFLTEVLQSDLSDAAKCVYRYFYRFSDRSSISRRYEHLMQAFPWNSGQKRFIVWLKTQLTELKERGVVESFEFQDEGVVVRCTPVNRLKKLVTAADDAKGQAIDVPSLTADENLLQQIPELKKQGKLSESAIKTLATIHATAGRSEAAKQLRRHLNGKTSGRELS